MMISTPNSASMKRRILCGILASAAVPTFAYAQEATPQPVESADAARGGGLEDIIVTAQKKNRGEKLQDVPIAATALGPAQLAAAHFQSLPDISTRAPGVSLSPNGLAVGFASFNIRGLGNYSGSPSAEPAVGTFIDGIYLGSNYGAILDTFDLEGVEILRGPQGTLQGRNVTGGAALIRTRRPGNELEVYSQASIETGPEYNIAASIGGPIAGDTISAKVAGYYRKDDGWFYNSTLNRKVGALQSWFVRPTVVIKPAAGFDQTFIGEVGRTHGDAGVFQQVPLGQPADALGFRVTSNLAGFTDLRYESVTSETNIEVPFGDGVITNLAGYRHTFNESLSDIDGGPTDLFNSRVYLNHRQFSEELRYAGKFGRLELTTGLYYFYQSYLYIEARDLFGVIHREYGSAQDDETFAAFGQAEYHFSDKVSVVLGGRYTTEKRNATVYLQPSVGNGGNCNIVLRACNGTQIPNYVNSYRWPSFTPKFGVNYKPDDNVLIYANVSEGIRNGGFNARQSANRGSAPGVTPVVLPNTIPGTNPFFDVERQWSYEVGLKSDLFDRRVRFNLVGYFNEIKGLQRDFLKNAEDGNGTINITTNATDADIYGFEAELTWLVDNHLTLNANVGYVGIQYKNVTFDLSGDNKIDAIDFGLKPPRSAPWNYNIGATYRTDLSDSMRIAGTINYSYRSRTPSDDQNSIYIQATRNLTADLTLSFPDKGLEVSVYAKNILDVTQEAFFVNVGPFQTRAMLEGRSIGLQGKLHF